MPEIVSRADSCSGRSREGAWIEIVAHVREISFNACRSREGAWIEIQSGKKQITGK